MLYPNKINSLARPNSSFIKLSKEGRSSLFSFSLKFKEIVKCNASLNNQCPRH